MSKTPTPIPVANDTVVENPDITPKMAAEVHFKLNLLLANVNKAVRTRELDTERQTLEREVVTCVRRNARVLLETYLAMYTEYRPLLLALQPVIARIGSFQIAAQQQVAAQQPAPEAK